MGMYVSQTTSIQVPVFHGIEQKKEKDLVVENLKGLDYARRRMIPAIKNYVIIPFEEGLASNAREGAREAEKISLEDILTKKHTERFSPGTKIMIDTTIFPDTVVEYKKTLDEFTNYLNSIFLERTMGLRRERVKSKRNNIYIESSHAARIMQQIHSNHSRSKESLLFILKDTKTEKRIETILKTGMNIVFDREQNIKLSSENLIQYYDALGMIESLKIFMQRFKEYYMGKNNITTENLDSKIQKDYPLAKGGIIRMLFYPQREIDYRQIYHDIAGNPRKTLVPDTGDIDILASIPPAMENYYHEKDKSKLRVELNKTKVRITRERKSHGPQAQTYHVLFHDNKIYVNIRDMLNRMEESKKANTEKIIRLKVDPIMPEPRFNR